MRASRALERIQRDPVWFCREVLGFEPWSRQREILEAVRDCPRVAVRSCHGPGKTALAARVVLWYLAAFPHSRVITTAPTWGQVRDLLWREIRAGYHAAGGFFDGTIHDTKLELADDWLALGLSTDQPERFQGHHAEHLLLVVDEASGVGEEIFEAASGFLTSPESRLLLIGNPTRTSGEFFRAFSTSRAFYRTVAISAFDTPAFTGERVPERVLRRLVSREWVEEHARKWGEGSPVFQVRVLGEFPSSTDDTVVALGEVEAAQARAVEPAAPVVVACDVARFGSDETVIVVREGLRVRLARSYRGRDTMRTAGEVARVAREAAASRLDHPWVVVDDAGVGGGVVDRLRELGEFRVVPFLGAGRSSAPGDYPNRRSEAWFRFAEVLPEVDLDPDEQLAADLVAARYSIDSAGRRVVEAKAETKRRIGRSPDRADAVLMAFSVGGRGVAGSVPVVEEGGPRPRDDAFAGIRYGMSL